MDDGEYIERTPFAPNSLLEGPEAGIPSSLVTQAPPSTDLHDTTKVTERSPLLRRSTSRRRRASVGPHGDATVTQAVLMVRILHDDFLLDNNFH
jgi:solute carrier family 36 (proton-coupled amino acid transporter)